MVRGGRADVDWDKAARPNRQNWSINRGRKLITLRIRKRRYLRMGGQKKGL